MKRIFVLLIVSFLFTALPSESRAQDATRVGLGMGISNVFTPENFNSEIAVAMSTVSVPITGRRFRIEPMVGFVRTSDGDEDFEYTQSGIRLGAGVFGLTRSGQTLYYFGAQAGLTRMSTTFDFPSDMPFGPEDESKTDYFIAPTTGVEYFFAETFSLGGEIQLRYSRFGQDESQMSDISSSAILTNTVFFVRWHF